MGLEDHIKKNVEKHSEIEEQRIERWRRKVEEEPKRSEEKKELEIFILRNQIRILENRRYTVYKGDLTRFWNLTRLFAAGFEVKVGDFKYYLVSGSPAAQCGPSVSSKLSYKGTTTAYSAYGEYSEHGSQNACYYPDWDITLPTKLVHDADEVGKLKSKIRNIEIFGE